MTALRVLIGCEESGIMRRAFAARGHYARSCDLQPARDGSPDHIQGDVRDVLHLGWDLAIFHPDCTYRTNAAAWALQDPDHDRWPGVGYHQRVKPGTLTGHQRRVARLAALDNVFSFAAHKGLPPNPLYKQGFRRVGCFPCINASKAELAKIGRHHPEHVARIQEWEALVADASKRGGATFFASDVTPEGAALGKASHGVTPAESAMLPWPRADQVFEWAKTSRGGKQFNFFDEMAGDDGLSCSSQYGLCE